MIDILYIDIRSIGYTDYCYLFSKLSFARKNRVIKYSRYSDKIKCLLSEYLLRFAFFNTFYDEIDLNNIRLSKFGKPTLDKSPNFFFNISHSGNYVGIAYGEVDVGFDIQEKVTFSENIVTKCFKNKEFEQFGPYNKQEVFFKLWTIKESYVKLLGLGLNKQFRDITYIKDIDIIDGGKDNKKAKLNMSKEFEKNHFIAVCSYEKSEVVLRKINIEDIKSIL